LDHLQILPEAVDLRDVTLDRHPLILGQLLRGEPGSTLAPEHIASRIRRDQVRMQDRLHDVL
jgi:hypothetical protein